MTTTHTPPRTRSQAAASAASETGTSHSEDVGATSAETSAFEAVSLELEKLRKERRLEQAEQQNFRREMEARLQERDVAISQLEERLVTHQLSPSNNICPAGIVFETSRAFSAGEGARAGRAARENPSEAMRAIGAGEGARAGRATRENPSEAARVTGTEESAYEERAARVSACATSRPTAASESANAERAARGLKLKPDNYDGTAPLREFLAQFLFVARANQWSESDKAAVLASCLRGKARSLLDSGVDGIESLTFADLKTKLELRFGESELAQNFYLQFTNRKQTPGEDFASLGADLERLSRKAYPESTDVLRDKIACTQFVAALSDGYIKRSLQTEGIISLRIAIERAKTLRLIDKNSFPGRKDNFSRGFRSEQKGASSETSEERKKQLINENKLKNAFKGQKKGEARRAKECWKCGKVGHFRSECPAQGQEN